MRQADGTPVDPLVRPRPHHLQAQARRRQRAQGDGGGGEGGVVATFTRLVVGADLDAVELEGLRQLASETLGRRPAGDRQRAEGRTTDARRAARQGSAPAPRGSSGTTRAP